jgi:hypothetical protein
MSPPPCRHAVFSHFYNYNRTDYAAMHCIVVIIHTRTYPAAADPAESLFKAMKQGMKSNTLPRFSHWNHGLSPRFQ